MAERRISIAWGAAAYLFLSHAVLCYPFIPQFGCALWTDWITFALLVSLAIPFLPWRMTQYMAVRWAIGVALGFGVSWLRWNVFDPLCWQGGWLKTYCGSQAFPWRL